MDSMPSDDICSAGLGGIPGSDRWSDAESSADRPHALSRHPLPGTRCGVPSCSLGEQPLVGCVEVLLLGVQNHVVKILRPVAKASGLVHVATAHGRAARLIA